MRLVVRRAVRQIRSAAAAARLPDLPRGLRDLPFAEHGGLPQSCLGDRAALHRGGGEGARRIAVTVDDPDGRGRHSARARLVTTISRRRPPLPGRPSAGPVADRQGAAVKRGFPTFIFDIVHAVPGDWAGLRLLAADRLPGSAGRRQVPEALYYNPYFICGAGSRHAAAALRRAGRPMRRTRTRTRRTMFPRRSTSMRRT